MRTKKRTVICKNGYKKHYDSVILKQLERSGEGSYFRVMLHDAESKRKAKTENVHRLVAQAFIGALGEKQVNHKDLNKQNNFVENLEIVTAKENNYHFRKLVDHKPNLGNKHTKSTREKISEKTKGRKAPNTAFTNLEALDIIKRKKKGEKRGSVYKDYSHKITLVGFENIWYGKSYKKIWEELR